MTVEQNPRHPEAIRVSEQRFRLIFDTAFQFIGLLEVDGTMLEVNRSALAWVRSSRESVLGRHVWDTPWWVNAGDAVLSRLRESVAAAGRGEFVRYDVALPSVDGPTHTFDFSLTPVTDEGGDVILLVAEGRDITELKRLEAALREANQQLQVAQEQARQLAITDALTGLYNRRGFFLMAERQKRLAIRSGVRGLLLFVDVDGLKGANDEYGHEVGDTLIAGAATLLVRTFRSSDLVARLGGDEFAVLAALSPSDSAATFTARLTNHVDAFNDDVTRRTPLRVSAGAHEFEWTDGFELEALIARADRAMYEQKRDRRRRLDNESS